MNFPQDILKKLVDSYPGWELLSQVPKEKRIFFLVFYSIGECKKKFYIRPPLKRGITFSVPYNKPLHSLEILKLKELWRYRKFLQILDRFFTRFFLTRFSGWVLFENDKIFISRVSGTADLTGLLSREPNPLNLPHPFPIKETLEGEIIFLSDNPFVFSLFFDILLLQGIRPRYYFCSPFSLDVKNLYPEENDNFILFALSFEYLKEIHSLSRKFGENIFVYTYDHHFKKRERKGIYGLETPFNKVIVDIKENVFS